MLVCATLTTVLVDVFGGPAGPVNGWSWLFSVMIVDPGLVAKATGLNAAWVDPVYWSLWVEVRFYAIIAVVFLLFRARFLASWLVFQVAAVVLMLAATRAGGGMQRAVELALVPSYLPYFTLGVCFYEVFRTGRWGPLPVLGIVLAAVVAIVNAPALLAVEGLHSLSAILLAHGVMIGLFALFVARSPLVAVFGSRPWARLGQASYSLYLLHMWAGLIVMNLLAQAVPPLVALAATCVLVVGASLLIYRFVELPAKRLLLRITARPVAALGRRAAWQSYASRRGAGA
jgi:peptidoglycan/LPS O-acetylase OafA/YrhL